MAGAITALGGAVIVISRSKLTLDSRRVDCDISSLRLAAKHRYLGAELMRRVGSGRRAGVSLVATSMGGPRMRAAIALDTRRKINRLVHARNTNFGSVRARAGNAR